MKKFPEILQFECLWTQKSILLLRFLRTFYNSMSWGCPGIFESSRGMDVVSNRWESIISLFRDYIPIGSRDTKIQKFWNVTYSYLRSQILAFLTAWSLWFALLCFGSFRFILSQILVQPKDLNIRFSQLWKFILWRV